MLRQAEGLALADVLGVGNPAGIVRSESIMYMDDTATSAPTDNDSGVVIDVACQYRRHLTSTNADFRIGIGHRFASRVTFDVARDADADR